MHLVIKFENLSPEISVSWPTLNRVVESIKTFYPKDSVQVDVEFSFARSFVVNPIAQKMTPKEPILVSVAPIAGPLDTRNLINPQFQSVLRKLVSLIITFLEESDPANDPSVQPQSVISSVLKISNGMGQFTFINGEFNPHL